MSCSIGKTGKIETDFMLSTGSELSSPQARGANQGQIGVRLRDCGRLQTALR